MLYMAVGLLFTAILLGMYGVLRWRFQYKLFAEARMTFIETMDKPYEEVPKSFGERLILPALNGFGSMMTGLFPNRSFNMKKRKLEKAGYLKQRSYERWVVMIFLRNAIVTVGFLLLSYQLKVEMVKAVFFLILLLGLLKYVDRIRLLRALKERQKNMLRDLPFTLDLITVSVEAGVSLDGAIARVANNIQGSLSDEFAKTLKEMRMGLDKKTALKNMGERCELKEISVLMSSLIQADELGVSLGKVLRIEGAQLRENRKQVAKEKAMKAPVKMLFPLILFIFPAIFVIILAPALIQVVEMF